MISDILELIKIRILVSSLFTTILGYVVGIHQKANFSIIELLILIVGCSCMFAAASSLNHFLERDVDAIMERTKNRPLVKGRLSDAFIFKFVSACLVLGTSLLLIYFDVLVYIMALLVFVLYVFIYTPLKRLSSSNTIVGAFPGAMPLLCGWAVHNYNPSLLIILLFSIFYFWQLPHFYAIAWMNKSSYENAKLMMISNGDDSGSKTAFALNLSTLLFLLSTISPYYYGLLSYYYLAFMILLGLYLVKTVFDFYSDRSILHARKILRATIYYPPVLLLSIMIDLLVN